VLTAAETAISNPLIEDPSIKRASGLLISITGGKDLTLFEVDEAASRIREEADQDANIIVGATFDDSLEGIVRVSVVATGIDNTGVAHQIHPGESALTELAGKLRSDSRRIGDTALPSATKDMSFQPMPTSPSLFDDAQTEPSMPAAIEPSPPAAFIPRDPERVERMPRMPRPQNQIRAQRKELGDDYPEKRRMTLMQRLASVGLGLRAEEGS
jgi:cell division protein FtsZ